MDIKNKIRQSQSDIINDLAECESAIGKLYGEYGRLIPESAEFWTRLAHEEMQHAAMLRSFHRTLEKGNLFFNLGKFTGDSLKSVNVLTGQELEFARKETVSHAHALTVAVKIENMLLEAKFYDTITSDAPEFQIIAKKLADDTRVHLASIQQAMASLPAEWKPLPEKKKWLD